MWAGRDVGERKEGNEGRREREEDDTERTGGRRLREHRKRNGEKGRGQFHYQRCEAEREPETVS